MKISISIGINISPWPFEILFFLHAVGDNKNLEFPSKASRFRLAHELGSKDFPTKGYLGL